MTGRSMVGAMLVAGVAAVYASAPRIAHAEVAPNVLHASAGMTPLDDTLLGRSGKLRARFLPATEARELERALGAMRATSTEGGLRSRIASLHILPIVPFASKIAGRMGMYRMGFWPGEKRTTRSVAYGNPPGFIEVTPGNQDLQVSEHFRLRDFVTKDQAVVWPKYLVLREALHRQAGTGDR